MRRAIVVIHGAIRVLAFLAGSVGLVRIGWPGNPSDSAVPINRMYVVGTLRDLVGHRRIWARKPGPSGLGGSACLVGSFLAMDVLLDDLRWGCATGCGEVGRRPHVSGGAGVVDLAEVFLTRAPG